MMTTQPRQKWSGFRNRLSLSVSHKAPTYPPAMQRTSVETAVHKLPIVSEGEGGSVKHRKSAVEMKGLLEIFHLFCLFMADPIFVLDLK